VISTGAVCLLCRRQFANGEQLLRHERESKLHAENLAKQAASLQSTAASASSGSINAPSAPAYRDRASERRANGPSYPILDSSNVEDSSNSNDVSNESGSERKYLISNTTSVYTSSVEPPRDLKEDIHNPGNQLLRKMGWTEGQGLGKDLSGIENPIESVVRIGSKAGIGAPQPTDIPSTPYGEGSAYRESLLKATRARYEQISKQS
jgi:RNA-binding protein 5/10